MGGIICSNMDPLAVDDTTNRSPWDAWCKQMEKDENDASMGVFTFTPEEYIDFYIKIEEEMRKENKPCKNGDTGNPLVFKEWTTRR
jgi:hypothetical protein